MFNYELVLVILSLVSAIAVCSIILPVIVKIASLSKSEYNSVSVNTNGKVYRSLLGGAGVALALIITFALTGKHGEINSYPFLVAGLSLIFLIDLEDDFIFFQKFEKKIIQILSASLIVIFGNLGLYNLNGFLGIYELPWLAGTTLSIIVVCTIMNLMIKLNENETLAAGIGLIGSFIFSLWFWSFKFYTLALFGFIFSGALIGYLIYNSNSLKIGLGNSGAYAIGFLLSFLMLQFINVNSNVVSGPLMKNAHIFAFSILLIPAVDSFRIGYMKVFKKYSSFKTGKNTFYFQLLQTGMNRNLAAFVFLIVSLILIGLAYLLNVFEVNLYSVILILISISIISNIKKILLALISVRLRSFFDKQAVLQD